MEFFGKEKYMIKIVIYKRLWDMWCEIFELNISIKFHKLIIFFCKLLFSDFKLAIFLFDYLILHLLYYFLL